MQLISNVGIVQSSYDHERRKNYFNSDLLQTKHRPDEVLVLQHQQRVHRSVRFADAQHAP